MLGDHEPALRLSHPQALRLRTLISGGLLRAQLGRRRLMKPLGQLIGGQIDRELIDDLDTTELLTGARIAGNQDNPVCEPPATSAQHAEERGIHDHPLVADDYLRLAGPDPFRCLDGVAYLVHNVDTEGVRERMAHPDAHQRGGERKIDMGCGLRHALPQHGSARLPAYWMICTDSGRGVPLTTG